MRYVAVVGVMVTALCALSADHLVGQGLPIKRDLPPLPSNACEARGYVFDIVNTTSPEAAVEAEGLASEASQAAILGQYQQARSLLGQAAELDSSSPSIRYSFGRLLEGGDELEAALYEYCWFLEIGGDPVQAPDVEARVARIGTAVGALGVSPARAAFEDGVRSYDGGDFDQAVLDFSRALVELPEWDQAHFNRAVSYLSSGREAAGRADLEYYLELAPGAADRTQVEAQIGQLVPVADYRPRTALVSGLIIPGMGYFYSGRPGPGILALGAAGVAVGFALLQREVELKCASPPVNGECPAANVLSETERRPLMGPGLAAAAAITVLGAVHAALGARRPSVQPSTGGGLEGRLPGFLFRGARPTLRVEPTRGVGWGPGLRAELEVRF